MSQLTYEQEILANRRQVKADKASQNSISAELSRYLAVSAGALAADISLLFLLSGVLQVHYLLANPIAFTFGALLAYAGSIHWAFRHRRMSNSSLELAIFIAIGVGGLLVNEAVLWMGIEVAALSLLFAKAAAATTSFAFNFIARKMVLFSA